MKECYRLNWKEKFDSEFLQNSGELTMILIYVAKEEKKYNLIQEGMLKLLDRLKNEILKSSGKENSADKEEA